MQDLINEIGLEYLAKEIDTKLRRVQHTTRIHKETVLYQKSLIIDEQDVCMSKAIYCFMG